MNKTELIALPMDRIAFKMKLLPGFEAEYQRRHDLIWPELRTLLQDQGISRYSIFLDEESSTLFGILNISSAEKLDELPSFPVMQQWWQFMKDIMETNSDGSPVSTPLKEVFFLP